MSDTNNKNEIFSGEALLFGSDEMKELLIKAYNEPEQYYESVMREVYNSVWHYAYAWIVKGFEEDAVFPGSKPLGTKNLTEEDRRDAVCEIIMAVRRGLDRFILNVMENDYSPAQRQAWLRSLIYKRLADFLKKMAAKLKEDGDDALEKYKDESVSDFSESLRFKETLGQLVSVACSAPYKPEKILVYLFNMFIFREISGREQNCDSKRTCRFIDGKTWFTLKKQMLYAFERVYDVRLSADLIKPICDAFGEDKPTEKGQVVCDVSPKTVTDWTNRMNTYMFKCKDNFYKAEGEDSNESRK